MRGLGGLNVLLAFASLALGAILSRATALGPDPVGWPDSVAQPDSTTRSDPAPRPDFAPRPDSAPRTGSATRTERALDRDRGVLVDSTGHPVTLRDFRRIVSGNAVIDGLLLALAEPERILAYSRASGRAGSYRFSGKPELGDLADLERLIELDPDLVLIHGALSPAKTARLRRAGLCVFDLGGLRGLSTLLPDIAQLSRLLGHPERGVRLAGQLRARLERLSRSASTEPPVPGMVLTVRGGSLFGGTRGTSYYDVLEAAGVIDVAATRFSGWPRYTSEQILELDPDAIVTETGMADDLCRHPGLDRLRACSGAGRIVEVEGTLLSSAGLDMLEAAEQIVDRLRAEALD